ncbi:MAG TPA: ribonuclease P protein component [Xanthobacteraceae bacterium]|nr:ribonuclease P protein component [Xanthobacteraceae bacterium]
MAKVATMERLKRRVDFKAAAQAARAPAGAFVLQARRRDGETGHKRDTIRVGFTVSRQVGNAVERNRVRRRLREMVRLAPAAALHTGHDYVVIGRRAALDTGFAAMTTQFAAALRRLHAGPASGQGSGLQSRPQSEPEGAQGRGQERAAARPSGGSSAVLHKAGSLPAPRSHPGHAAPRNQRQDES